MTSFFNAAANKTDVFSGNREKREKREKG